MDDMDTKFVDVKNDISQLWEAYNGNLIKLFEFLFVTLHTTALRSDISEATFFSSKISVGPSEIAIRLVIKKGRVNITKIREIVGPTPLLRMWNDKHKQSTHLLTKLPLVELNGFKSQLKGKLSSVYHNCW